VSDYLTYFEKSKQYGMEKKSDTIVNAHMNRTQFRVSNPKLTVSANSLIHDYGLDQGLVDGALAELRGAADNSQGATKENYLRILNAFEQGTFRPGKDTVIEAMDKMYDTVPSTSSIYKLIPDLKAVGTNVFTDAEGILNRKSVELDAKKAKLVGLSDENRTKAVNKLQQDIDDINTDCESAVDDISNWDGSGTAPSAYGA